MTINCTRADEARERDRHNNRLREGKPDRKPTGPPGWGLGYRPITCSQKTKLITETATIPNSICLGKAATVDGVTAKYIMMSLGQSQREAQRPTKSLATPKTITRLGCWNVHTLYTTAQAEQVARETDKYRFDILGLSETRWTGAGRTKLANDSTLIYSGEEEEHQRGVALMISKEAKKSLMECKPVSSRVISA